MNAKEVARGGLLAAAAVVLLYMGSLMPWAGVAFCIMAGVTSAVPLLRRSRLKAAVVLFVTAAILSAILLPRKSIVIGYVLVCGLYPIVKFCVECYAPRRRQMDFKLAYFNITLVIAAALAIFVFLPQFTLSGFRLVVAWVAANIVFVIYDVALSRLIALLRRSLPPD